MKNLKMVGLLAFALALSTAGMAQTKKDTNSVGKDIKHAAKEVGHKTAEVASKGASTVVDRKYKDKVGPQGQTIYITNESRYYYVNDKGERVYVKKSALKNK